MLRLNRGVSGVPASCQPWITVVTPSLDQGQFIVDAIESVLAQSETAGLAEHIVVDGGSTDGTHELLARYPHLTVLRDEGRGQSPAVNMGLRAASGIMIGWLNADDRYLPGAFEGVRRGFEEHPAAGVVYSNAEAIDESGTVIGEIRSGPFDLQRMLNGRNNIPQPSVFIRASLLDRIGVLDESLDYVMDFELWLRASRVTRLVWIDEAWAQFRMHSESKTVSRAYAFWPEKRAVARAYGGPFFSEEWRSRTINRHYPGRALESLWRRAIGRRSR